MLKGSAHSSSSSPRSRRWRVLPARGLAATNGEPTLLGFTDDLGLASSRGCAGRSQGASSGRADPSDWTGCEGKAAGARSTRRSYAARASGQRLLLTVTGFQGSGPRRVGGVPGPSADPLSRRLGSKWLKPSSIWPASGGNGFIVRSVGRGSSDGGTRRSRASTSSGRRSRRRSLASAAYQTALYAALPDDVGVGVNLFTYRGNSGDRGRGREITARRRPTAAKRAGST